MLEYEDLTEPERAVWNAIEAGTPVALPLGSPAVRDHATGGMRGESCQVRAQLLYELLVGVSGPKDIPRRALLLAGALITGTLDLQAATLTCPLNLRHCSFEQPILLQEAQAPSVRLLGCHVPGIKGQQFQTQGNFELSERFAAAGEVSLLGARIGGSLSLIGATLTNSGGTALYADGLTVDQDMLCGGGFTANGEVSLVGAHIGGQLNLNAATLTNRGGRALNADALTVGQAMFCRERFSAKGEVNLLGARISEQLSLDDATLINPDGVALDLERVRTTTLLLRYTVRPEGTVDLTNAHVDAVGDSQATWPQQILLGGFGYITLVADPEVDVTTRLRWLERDPSGYLPQLYEQLAAAYRGAGHDDDARRVAITKQRRRRQTLDLPGKWWSSLLRWTVGYGYQTWKAGVWLVVLVAVGWLIFDRAYPAHLVAAKPVGQRPWFHAGLYALDLLLPFADLGYQGAWIAVGWARWFYLAWNLAGWVLITAVIAALSGLIKRD